MMHRGAVVFALAGLLALATGCASYPEPLVKIGLQMARSNAGMRQVGVPIGNGMEVSIADSGKARGGDPTPVVCFHGFTAAKESFLDFSRTLTPERRVILVDLIGHGLSDCAVDNRYAVPAQAERMRQTLAVMGIDRCHVVGHSMGGGVAAMLAALDPERVASLALMAPLGMPDPLAQAFKDLQNGTPSINPLLRHSAWSTEKAIAFATGDAPEPNPYNPNWVELAVKSADAVAKRRRCQVSFSSMFAQIETFYLEPSILRRIMQPTLIIWGAQDRILDPRGAEWFVANLPNATKPDDVPFAGIGHLAPVEKLTRVAAEYMEFLDRLPRVAEQGAQPLTATSRAVSRPPVQSDGAEGPIR